MSEHTPGPWAVVVKRGVWVGPVVMADNGKRGIAFVVGESDANARLIAAAPELLAAIKQGLHQMEHSTGQQDLRALFRSAINKAEGRVE